MNEDEGEYWVDEQHCLEPVDDRTQALDGEETLVRDVRGRLWRVRRGSACLPATLLVSWLLLATVAGVLRTVGRGRPGGRTVGRRRPGG